MVMHLFTCTNAWSTFIYIYIKPVYQYLYIHTTQDLAAGGHLDAAKQLVLFLVEHNTANEHTLAQFFNVCWGD